MKKIFPIMILAILALGALALYPRGGGSGLEEWSNVSQMVPSIPQGPSGPAMCTADQALDPLQKQPIDSKPLSSARVVELPATLQVNSYCLNKASKLGGATVTVSQGLAGFINVPPNCSVVVDEDSLHAKKVVCSGPAGSTVTLTVQNSCTPPATNQPDVVQPSCPQDFVMDSKGFCSYLPKRDSPTCPMGYHFETESNCCREDTPGGFSACPTGYVATTTYQPGVEESTYVATISCVRQNLGTVTKATQNYAVTLDSCGVSDQTNDRKPVPCVIDPATGSCK